MRLRENNDWLAANEATYFYNFVLRCYAHRAVLGLRRHIKPKDDSVSLARMIGQIAKAAPQVTLAFYRGKFPIAASGHDWQSGTFGRFSDDGACLSTSRIGVDLDHLRSISSRVEAYGDRALAHLDERGFQEAVTFVELDEVVHHFNLLTCRYLELLKGEGWGSLEAAVQFHWERAFEVPLIEPKQKAQGRIS